MRSVPTVFGTFCRSYDNSNVTLLHYCSHVIIVITKRIITTMMITIIKMYDVSRKFRFLMDSVGEGWYTRHKITHCAYVRAFNINSYTCTRDCSRFVRSAFTVPSERSKYSCGITQNYRKIGNQCYKMKRNRQYSNVVRTIGANGEEKS